MVELCIYVPVFVFICTTRCLCILSSTNLLFWRLCHCDASVLPIVHCYHRMPTHPLYHLNVLLFSCPLFSTDGLNVIIVLAFVRMLSFLSSFSFVSSPTTSFCLLLFSFSQRFQSGSFHSFILSASLSAMPHCICSSLSSPHHI